MCIVRNTERRKTMATKPKKFPYTILRDDNTYLTYDMSRKEFDDVFLALSNGRPFIKIDAGILSLKDIRHIIEYIAPEQPQQEAAEVPLSPEEMIKYNEYVELFGDEEEDGSWLN
jgi:hypothetical protein